MTPAARRATRAQVAPPLYVLTTQTLEKDVGIALLNEAVEAAKAAIEASKGRLVVKEAARAVSERDEKLLAEKLDKLAAANEEVDGDEDEEEDETMGDIDVDAAPALSIGADGSVAAAPKAAAKPKAKADDEDEEEEEEEESEEEEEEKPKKGGKK